MASGASVGGVCYADLQQAADQWCGAYGGPTAGGMVQCFLPQALGPASEGSGWTVLGYLVTTVSATGEQHWSSQQLYGYLPQCEPLTLDDGFTLGWGVAAVFLAVFGIKFLQRALALARDGE